MPRQSVSIPFAKGRRRRHHKDGGAFASHPSGVSIPFAKGRRRRPLPLPGTQPALRQGERFNPPPQRGGGAPPPSNNPLLYNPFDCSNLRHFKKYRLTRRPKNRPLPVGVYLSPCLSST